MFNIKFMELALKEAEKAYKKGEIPIGAVIVKDDNIIAKAYNLKEKNASAFDHAEVLAIKKTNKKLSNWRLDGCDLYVTMEPCPMCTSLAHQSRISNIYYCVKKNNKLNYEIINQIAVDNFSNKKTNLCYVNCGKKYSDIIKNFFSKRR